MNTFRIQQLKTMSYEKYLQTPEWAKKRDQVLERDGHCCRVCNSHDDLQVHHRTYARRGNEDLNDLTTLCQPCHEHFHERLKLFVAPIDPQEEKEEIDLDELERRNTLKAEYRLLGSLVTHTELRPYVIGILSEEDFLDVDASALYQIIRSAAIENRSLDIFSISGMDEIVYKCVKYSDPIEKGLDGKGLVVETIGWAARVKRMSLVRISKELQKSILDAANAKDAHLQRELCQQLLNIHRQLRTIDTANQL